jgi:heme A synthase
MSKFVRIAAAVGIMALVMLALLVPVTGAVAAGGASPAAAAAWPECGGGVKTHCITRACHGNEVWDYYWTKYPTNLEKVVVDPFLQCA